MAGAGTDAEFGTRRRDLAPDPVSHVDQPATERSAEHTARRAASLPLSRLLFALVDSGRAAELITTERSAAYAVFVIERTYDAPPSRVFEAFASRAARGRCFIGPDLQQSDHGLDFRVVATIALLDELGAESG